MKQELIKIRDWGLEIIANGSQPPWVGYQYMKLVEAIEALLDETAVTIGPSEADAGGEAFLDDISVKICPSGADAGENVGPLPSRIPFFI